jgi:hypothetical protein
MALEAAMSQLTLAWPRYVSSTVANLQVREYAYHQPVSDLLVANEVRALAELPLEKYLGNFYLEDDSETGRRIHLLLQQSEDHRDVSFLEEAGELLMEQSTRRPGHWQSPALPPWSPPPSINELSDNAYQFSPVSNDPFAKVGCVKIVESRAIPQHTPVSNEPQHMSYPDLLINPPERWLRKSSTDPQPMRLIKPIFISNIQPASFSKSSSWLDQQVQRQLGATPTSSEQKAPFMPIKPKPLKAPAPRMRKPKPTLQPTPPANQHTGGLQRPQGQPGQPFRPINPYFSVPKWQEGQSHVSPAITGSQPQMNAAPYKGSYSNNANQFSGTLPRTGAHPTANPGVNYNQFPSPPMSATALPSIQPAPKPITKQQPYNHDTRQQPSTQSPAIRTPTSPLTSSFQGDMPWLKPKSAQSKPATAATEPTEIESYDEEYRKAKETADNLKETLAKK